MHVAEKKTPQGTLKTMWREGIPLTTSPLRFLFFTSRPYLGWVILALLSVTVAASLNAATSFAYKLIINNAIHYSETGISGLWWAAALYIALSLGGGLMWRVSGFTGMRWITGVRATARFTLSSYVSHHGFQYFSDRFSGSISSKVRMAANGMSHVTETILWQFGAFTVTMIAGFFIMLSASPMVAYIFLAWVIVITPLNLYMARKRAAISAASQKAETALTGATVDLLSNIPTVHEYTGRIHELDILKRLITKRRTTGLRNWRFGEWTLLLNTILENVFVGGMILLSVYFVAIGKNSPGDIALVLTVILMAADRLTFIGSELNNFANDWGMVIEGLDDILRPYEIVDKPDARKAEISEGGVSLERVSFHYDGLRVFNNLSLEIPQGQKVGLVGRSGAGKTTLIKLLLRHYELSNGTIRIGGEDITGITLDSLRSAIAVVPQEPLLFHRSIHDNIAYARPDASREDVIRAAKQAQAHEFISALQEGYDSLVGERGVKLSGGQRQRVAIARAILKDAPVLLLDEATSALDSESEVAVQKALYALMEGRTVIAIAHRLSTLRTLDRIIVMDDGVILEDGTHDELVKKGGLYSELWSHQAGGFLE